MESAHGEDPQQQQVPDSEPAPAASSRCEKCQQCHQVKRLKCVAAPGDPGSSDAEGGSWYVEKRPCECICNKTAQLPCTMSAIAAANIEIEGNGLPENK